MTHHGLGYAFAALGLLSSACGGGKSEPADTTTTTTTTTGGATTTTGAEPGPSSTATGTTGATEAGQPMGASGPTGAVTDEEVQAFSTVYAELMALQQEAQMQVQQGDDQEQVQAQIDRRVGGIFEQSPLTPDRYDEIGRRAAEDEDLRARIERELASIQPAPAAGGGSGGAP